MPAARSTRPTAALLPALLFAVGVAALAACSTGGPPVAADAAIGPPQISTQVEASAGRTPIAPAAAPSTIQRSATSEQESPVETAAITADEAEPTLPDGVGAACALISLPVMADILGGPVEAVSAGDSACVFHTEGDSPSSVEIAELPAAVLPSQLGEGTFTPVAGVGEQAFWSADETLLVAVKGPYELGINADVGDDQQTAQQTAVAVATAALPSL